MSWRVGVSESTDPQVYYGANIGVMYYEARNRRKANEAAAAAAAAASETH